MSCSLAKRALDPRICLAIDSLQESEDTIKNQQRINLKECLRTIVRPLMNLREDESSPVADLKHGVETCLALLEDWRSCNEAYSRRLIDVDILLEIPGPRWIPKTNRKFDVFRFFHQDLYQDIKTTANAFRVLLDLDDAVPRLSRQIISKVSFQQ